MATFVTQGNDDVQSSELTYVKLHLKPEDHSQQQPSTEYPLTHIQPESPTNEEQADEKKDEIQFMSLERLQSKYQTNIILDGDVRNSEGLSEGEAKRRLLKNGPNILSPPKEKSKIRKFFVEDLGHPLMLLLIISGILSLVAYILSPHEDHNLYTGCALVGAALLSSIFSYIQEGQASGVMKAFLSMLPRYANVIRDRKLHRIQARDLVVGDVVEVKGGDQVPADIRLIWVNECRIELSALTGESGSVSCSVTTDATTLEEARNIMPNTARCVEGDAIGVVFAVGDETMIGKIAKLASKTKVAALTPIQKEIHLFVRNLSIFAVILGLTFFAIGMGRGRPFIYAFINSFILVLIGVVPQGLPLLVVSSLSITARRLAKKRVFIKELRSVETLGSTTVIATDKTGTLTQNKMSLSRIWIDGLSFSEEMLRDVDHSIPTHPINLIEIIAGVCNRARYEDELAYSDAAARELEIQETLMVLDPILTIEEAQKKHPFYLETLDPKSTVAIELTKYCAGKIEEKKSDIARGVLGEPTETALFRLVQRRTNIELLRYHWKILLEVPFSSRTKFSLTIVKPHHVESFGAERKILVKGAPEVILSKCDYQITKGKIEPITEEFTKSVSHASDVYANAGERVLGFAYMDLDTKLFGQDMDGCYSYDPPNFPQNGYTFVGLVSLSDPPKEGVDRAVTTSREAGIRVIMVTGDHPLTAAAIARQVGIITTPSVFEVPNQETDEFKSVVLHGRQLDNLIETDWDNILRHKEIVFSRVTPQQKLEIVTQLQRLGEVVAVTGDGVNDAPALKKADCGVAMGISGSDASRDAADVILMDDDFSSIVRGIREGRTIYDNLKKAIASTLTQTVPEVIPALLDLALSYPLAITPILILCIDLGTELSTTISLAYEPAEANVMKKAPRNIKTDRLVDRHLIFYVFCQGGLILTSMAFLSFSFAMRIFGFDSSRLFFTNEYFLDGASPLTSHVGGHTYNEDEQVQILHLCQTAYWSVVVGTQLIHIFMFKTRLQSVFVHGILNNVILIYGVMISACLMVLIIYVPSSHIILGTRVFPPHLWGFVALSCVVMVIYHESAKFLKRTFPNNFLAKRLMF